MEKIIVIFEASNERVEGLALAFGLGAVQKKANIRLRHLNPSPEAKLAHQSYGALQPNDLRWAEGIAVFLESEEPGSLGQLLSALAAIHDDESTIARSVYLFSENPDAEAVRTIVGLLPPNTHRLEDASLPPDATTSYTTSMGQRMAEVVVPS